MALEMLEFSSPGFTQVLTVQEFLISVSLGIVLFTQLGAVVIPASAGPALNHFLQSQCSFSIPFSPSPPKLPHSDTPQNIPYPKDFL